MPAPGSDRAAPASRSTTTRGVTTPVATRLADDLARGLAGTRGTRGAGPRSGRARSGVSAALERRRPRRAVVAGAVHVVADLEAVDPLLDPSARVDPADRSRDHVGVGTDRRRRAVAGRSALSAVSALVRGRGLVGAAGLARGRGVGRRSASSPTKVPQQRAAARARSSHSSRSTVRRSSTAPLPVLHRSPSVPAPSTWSAAPEMKPAWAEHRNATTRAEVGRVAESSRHARARRARSVGGAPGTQGSA